jgi:hypothetical protein
MVIDVVVCCDTIYSDIIIKQFCLRLVYNLSPVTLSRDYHLVLPRLISHIFLFRFSTIRCLHLLHRLLVAFIFTSVIYFRRQSLIKNCV